MPARTTARWGAAIALLLTAGTLLAPAKAHTPPTTVPAPTVAPPALVGTIAEDGSLRLSQPAVDRDALVRMADRRYGVLGSLDVTRALLAQSHGLSLPDLHPASRLQPQPQPQAGSHGGAIVVPGVVVPVGSSPAGDLTGDGRDDVVLYEYDQEADATTVIAADGVDGSELWRRPPMRWEDGVAVPVADVTGDGRTDLFRLGLDVYEAACSEEELCNEWTTRHRWTYGVVSGADGGDVWTHHLEGSNSRSYEDGEDYGLTSSEWRYESVYEDVNGVVGIEPSTDRDGDGAADIVVNVLSSTQRGHSRVSRDMVVFEESEWGSTSRVTTDAAVLSGRDGSAVLTKRVADAPSSGWLAPAPQLVGGPAADFLWLSSQRGDYGAQCSSVNLVVDTAFDSCDYAETPEQSAVTAVDGATLEDGWTVTDEDPYSGAEVLSDLSGDGVADVALYSWSDTRFLSGADGALLWGTADSVVGADGDSVITARVDGGPFSEPNTVEVQRRDPADGSQVETSSFELDVDVESPNYDWFMLSEVDGHVLAVLAQASVRDDGVVEQGSHVVVEDGGRGLLLDRHTDDLRLAWAFADIDGDGATDLIETVDTVTPDQWGGIKWETVQRGFHRLDGSTLWTMPAGTWAQRGGDQDGAPGEEVVTTGPAGDGEHRRITSHDGPTGAPRWSITL